MVVEIKVEEAAPKEEVVVVEYWYLDMYVN
jgi:hypothetical protein